MNEKKLVQILVEKGHLSEANRNNLLQMQERSGRRLMQLATEVGLFSEEELIGIVAGICGLEVVELDIDNFVPEEWEDYIDFFVSNNLVPLENREDSILIALYDPTDTMLLRTIEIGIGKKISLSLTPQKEINRFWSEYFQEDESDNNEVEDVEHMIDIASEAPVVRVVSDITSRAVEMGASDIHLEARGNDLKLRYRIDGILHDFPSPPSGMASAIISRIKILANLDISERRIPQDGSIKLATSFKDVDVRVSIIPTVHGEGVVLRILDKENINLDMEYLGFSELSRQQMNELLKKSYGMIVVAGPTGAGKTTTLYACLQMLLDESIKIVTIEDPVEFKIPEVTQIQINEKAGLTFARGLRSMLRHDPDVILVGEMRDAETASISVQSALTGHLVLSTLHANRASQVFSRLIDMGVEPFLGAASILGTVSQRLVRRICQHCREEQPIPALIRERFGIDKDATFFRGRGCEKCNNTGFKGRLGIYEIIQVTDEIQRLILKNASASAIEEAARKNGFRSMTEDGIDKCLKGLTTMEEVMRVAE